MTDRITALQMCPPRHAQGHCWTSPRAPDSRHGSAGAVALPAENKKPLTPALSPEYRGEGEMSQKHHKRHTAGPASSGTRKEPLIRDARPPATHRPQTHALTEPVAHGGCPFGAGDRRRNHRLGWGCATRLRGSAARVFRLSPSCSAECSYSARRSHRRQNSDPQRCPRRGSSRWRR